MDDSATARRAVARLFRSEVDFEIVGAVAGGPEALTFVSTLKPDLVLLDVFLANEPAARLVRSILATWPVPILLISAASRDVPEVFEALAAGALDLLTKPRDGPAEKAFVRLARTLSKVKVRPHRQLYRTEGIQLVVIGSSTGGPGALRELLDGLPTRFPVPIVIAQHLAFGFEGSLASWLGQTSALPVAVAVDGETLRPGEVHLGQAQKDVVIAPERRLGVRKCPERGYHPSADLLFETAAAHFGSGVLGVILTGVGSDGTAGAKKLVAAGGMMMGQDKGSSSVFGMPGSVIRAGLASVIGPPSELAKAIVRCTLDLRGTESS